MGVLYGQLLDLNNRRSLYFARSPQRAARSCVGMFAILQYLGAVDEDVFHTNRILMRVLKSRAVTNRLWVKYNHVGEHPNLEQTPMIEPEILSR